MIGRHINGDADCAKVSDAGCSLIGFKVTPCCGLDSSALSGFGLGESFSLSSVFQPFGKPRTSRTTTTAMSGFVGREIGVVGAHVGACAMRSP